MTLPKKISVYFQELKHKAFLILGGKCQHCGETDEIVLTVDHIEPVGKSRKGSVSIWAFIVKNPIKAHATYQLLCRNCNWRKMIQNNERTMEQPFALKSELEELREQIQQNSRAIRMLSKVNHNRIRQSSHTPKHYPSLEYGEEALATMIYSHKQKILNEKGQISAKLLRLVFMTDLHMKIGHNKAYTIKEMLKLQHPSEFL